MKAKRRKQPLQPLLIWDSPWTPAEHKPPLVTGNDRSKSVLIYNGSYGMDYHIAWFDFYRDQWRNGYGEIPNVICWTDLPPRPPRRLP